MILLFIIGATVLIGLTSVLTGKAQVTAASGSPTPNTASTGNPANYTGVTVSNSDQSLTGQYITADPSTWPGASPKFASDLLWNICTAVALAEGFNVGPGAAPYDLNNPGDLSPGDEAGQATAGPGQFHGGSTVIQFRTCEGGFIALYTKFQRIVTGQSRTYPKSATWLQVAQLYAGDWSNWLNNVTNYLGVDPSSTPAQYVGL